MGLEAGTFINDLVVTNPIGATDTKSQGDDHLRLIKTVLKNTFPGLAGAGFRIQTKSLAYTVLGNDNTSLIRCTATLTLTLTAAATLGNQHVFYVYNDSRGIITIDPNSTELINGQRFSYVLPDQLAIVFCDGSGFFTLEDTSWNINPIYNSGMEIWQQWGSSSATVSAGQIIYGPDGFFMTLTGVSSQVEMFRGTNVPTVPNSQIYVNNSLEVQNKIAKTNFAAGTRCEITHIIEGYNYQSIAQRPFWFSFWAHSSVTGTYNISFKNTGLDRSYVDFFTINAANTLEYKTFLIDAPPSAGTWNYTSGTGLLISIALGGSSTQVAKQSWTAATAYLATANVNWNSLISSSFGLVAPQINLGSRPTLWKNYGVPFELQRCQRYYARSRDTEYGIMDSSATGAIGTDASFHMLSVGVSGFTQVNVFFPTSMRIKPIISLYGAEGIGGGGAGGLINIDGAAVSATVSADFVSTKNFSLIRNLNTTSFTGNASTIFNYIADSRL